MPTRCELRLYADVSDIAKSLKSIAASLEKLANPPVEIREIRDFGPTKEREGETQ